MKDGACFKKNLKSWKIEKSWKTEKITCKMRLFASNALMSYDYILYDGTTYSQGDAFMLSRKNEWKEVT